MERESEREREVSKMSIQMSGSSGTLLVVKMETQSSRWEPCSASPQHEVEQSRGPGHGQGRRGW